MKGLPLSYNRDLQEDKLPVFDTVDTVKACLTVMNDMFPGIRFNVKKMSDTAGDAYSTATDIAEYLVKKGMPFRKAHETTGKIVLYCIQKGKRFHDLSLKELQSFSDIVAKDIYSCLSPERSVRNKLSSGSTSIREVRRQIKKLKSEIKH